MPDSENPLPPLAERHLRVFRKSLPLQVKLHELLRAVGDTEGLTCLDIGADNGMLSYHLRRHGGKWHTAVTSQVVRDSVITMVGDNVEVLEGLSLPFKKKVFDVVVVVDCLERADADELFIEECHKILKADGRLILSVTRLKKWTLLTPVKRMLGMTPERLGLARPGYTESQLFRILKHGFDVHSVRSYSRFFVEITDVLVRAIEARRSPESDGAEGRASWFYTMAGILYRLAFQLDLLLFFARGHALIAVAKRRAWRPRNAPVLVDGRSITEAVLSKAAN